jgi:hypothetical protein
MTTEYHTPISTGAAATAATFNTVFAALDAQIKANTDTLETWTATDESPVETVADATVVTAGVVRQTTITIALTGDNKITLADGKDTGTGVKIYDSPAGRILVLGAVINCTTSIEGASGGAATVNLAVGTATASDDDELTSTEVNIIPSTATANGSSTWKAALATSAQFDGTSTAVDLYVNAGVADAVSASAVTIAIEGTLTVTWINLGDY